ncbi:MAG: hypothetical protein A3E85_03305 [Gammaproteobacteria bacterium RIFCSPHIGHO2_12_FULL_45_12]|nr:MAG: hypothetical protein A3E85_03305 [Gammaproteobacteria bacterium RIFCSPHIGHO2_12_FULL_45_12]
MLLCISLLSLTVHAKDKADQPTRYQAVVENMQKLGDELVAQYQPKEGLSTMEGFTALYFDHYEGSGMELSVAALSPTINIKTEAFFTRLINASSNGIRPDQLQITWAALKSQLTTDLALLNSHASQHFSQVFIKSFTILFREGVEALIIVTALLAYLRRSEHAHKTNIIYYGVGLALLASVVTAVAFITLFKNLGANREAIEGITMLTASAVMFYVSFWLLSKRDALKWQGFIKNKMTQALTSSSMFALGLTAFLAVYREGAETILFYQALLIDSKDQLIGVVAGFGAACLALTVIYGAMQRASVKIPYRLFFTLTALLLYVMSFSFVGGAILDLQEAGWINITPIPHFPQIEWLGLFPAWQNVGAQLLFVVPSVVILGVWYIRQCRQRHTPALAQQET